MDWLLLHCGTLTKDEILTSVKDEEWQVLREHLKGSSLAYKYAGLKFWLDAHQHSRKAQVQVTNYVNALKRGGLI